MVAADSSRCRRTSSGRPTRDKGWTALRQCGCSHGGQTVERGVQFSDAGKAAERHKASGGAAGRGAVGRG